MPADDLRPRVQAALDAFLAARLPQLDEVGPELAPLGVALVDLVRGGKRLRPAFCCWAYWGCGGSGDPVVAAASLELLQASALIHDDVMDGSDVRRGMPAAHVRFARMHREQGWPGDPEVFGRGAAILLGDLALSWADEMLAASGLPPDALERALRVHEVTRTELMAGQYLDLVAQTSGDTSLDTALRVTRWKAAKYTIERPLHLGVALAGGPDAARAAFTAYGLPLGEAFQLRDDVLGVFGDPVVTGKPAGDDLREGKRTALVARALAAATPAQASVVRRHLGDPQLDAAGLEALRTVVVDTGALAEVERLIVARTEAALAALAAAPVTTTARAALAELAGAATQRSV